MTVGSVLKAARKELDLSMREVGAHVYVIGPTVRSWEQDETEPNFGTIRKLCELYNITPNQLFEWGDGMTDRQLLRNIQMQIRKQL